MGIAVKPLCSTEILFLSLTEMKQRLLSLPVENVLLLLDYVVEYFKRNKLVLRLVERNFSWPMVAKQMSERRGPLWARLMRDLEASPLAARYTEDELFKMIFVIIEMLGSVCYSSIIEGKPDTVDNMKPVLYGIVRKILS